MKKIINPWRGMDGYNCFGCAPHNEAGVKMEFYEDGDEIVSVWRPESKFQSRQASCGRARSRSCVRG